MLQPAATPRAFSCALSARKSRDIRRCPGFGWLKLLAAGLERALEGHEVQDREAAVAVEVGGHVTGDEGVLIRDEIEDIQRAVGVEVGRADAIEAQHEEPALAVAHEDGAAGQERVVAPRAVVVGVVAFRVRVEVGDLGRVQRVVAGIEDAKTVLVVGLVDPAAVDVQVVIDRRRPVRERRDAVGVGQVGHVEDVRRGRGNDALALVELVVEIEQRLVFAQPTLVAVAGAGVDVRAEREHVVLVGAVDDREPVVAVAAEGDLAPRVRPLGVGHDLRVVHVRLGPAADDGRALRIGRAHGHETAVADVAPDEVQIPRVLIGDDVVRRAVPLRADIANVIHAARVDARQVDDLDAGAGLAHAVSVMADGLEIMPRAVGAAHVVDRHRVVRIGDLDEDVSLAHAHDRVFATAV